MIFIANDHGGVELKNKIIKFFDKNNIEFVDLGTNSTESVNYVIYAKKLCKKVLENSENKGILICKSGLGMSICANRFKGIRAGLCYNKKASLLARKHNDCNVLVLKGKSVFWKNIVKNFLNTPFEGGRHQARIESIDQSAVSKTLSIKK